MGPQVRQALLASGRKLEPYEITRTVAQLWREKGKEVKKEWVEAAQDVVGEEEMNFYEMVSCLNKI